MSKSPPLIRRLLADFVGSVSIGSEERIDFAKVACRPERDRIQRRTPAVFRIPGNIVGVPITGALLSSPRRVFPFRFCRQPSSSPTAIGGSVVPIYVYD